MHDPSQLAKRVAMFHVGMVRGGKVERFERELRAAGLRRDSVQTYVTRRRKSEV